MTTNLAQKTNLKWHITSKPIGKDSVEIKFYSKIPRDWMTTTANNDSCKCGFEVELSYPYKKEFDKSIIHQTKGNYFYFTKLVNNVQVTIDEVEFMIKINTQNQKKFKGKILYWLLQNDFMIPPQDYSFTINLK